jgi:FHS family L-fucose permease-like MFS transporter
LQNAVVDWTGSYLVSYWVIAAGLAFLLYYALIGCKNVNKDIPVE